ncbi:protein EI24 homolog [Humulus lupulus]|uniref:protein EI24 homolog n=1 Tax=Humulus lupulus TaxID=3486 RepID=UPI002B41469D|nr:protein EI24 homolog [Humulus lupulus]
MEAIKDLGIALVAKLEKASLLWIEGFREACCLHRVIVFYFRSKKLLIRTGQCFLLNGFIFLGSIFILNSVIIPTLQWILPDDCSQFDSQELCSFDGLLKFYSFLRFGLIKLFYITWFYPLYALSIILSALWYNDIAKYGFEAAQKSGPVKVDPVGQEEKLTLQNTGHERRRDGLGGIMIVIGEQLYSILLLSFFFIEVSVTGFVPYIGTALNFLHVSWMYAYFCFEYKWNLHNVDLDKRLNFFESNWAFFLGFGCPCALPVLFCSSFVSSGVMAMLYPLFVLTASNSEAEKVISSQTIKWGDARLGRLPIFYVADALSMKILSFLPSEPHEQLQDNKVE